MLRKKKAASRSVWLSGRKLSSEAMNEALRDEGAQEAWLCGNALSSFPVALLSPKKWGGLRVLDVSHNMIDALPEQLALSCPALEALLLENNRLQTIPLSFASSLPQLTCLRIANNPLRRADLAASFHSRLEVRAAIAEMNNRLALMVQCDAKLVLLRLEEWDFESLKDAVFDVLHLKSTAYRIYTQSGDLVSDSLPASIDETLQIERIVEQQDEEIPCSCLSVGPWACRVHNSNDLLFGALRDVEGLEAALKRGFNPTYRAKDGSTFLDLLLFYGDRREDGLLTQIRTLFEYGGFAETRASSVHDLIETLRHRNVPSSVIDFVAKLPFERHDDSKLPTDGVSMSDFELSTKMLDGVCSSVHVAEFRGKRQCVVKIQNKVHNELLRKQFECEHRIHSDLSHRNIIPLIGMFEGCLVLPFVSKNLLQVMTCRHRRTAAPYWDNFEIQVYARQLLQAIAYLQRQGVIHRDVKPDNILVRPVFSRLPSLLLCDFGMASLATAVEFAEKGFGVGGASRYLPPEIKDAGRGSVLDYSKSDNWGAGVVLHEMVGEDKVDPEVRALIDGLRHIDFVLRLSVQEALTMVERIKMK